MWYSRLSFVFYSAMKKVFFIFFLTSFLFHAKAQQSDSAVIKSIYNEILTNGASYQWLDDLANGIGGRLSGSPQAAAAVTWAKQVMDTLGLDSVWLQPVMVPHWVRGEKEIATIISPNVQGSRSVNITALGNSVGTGKNGLTAEVVEVSHMDEIAMLGKEKIKDKIVFINIKMDPTNINAFDSYGKAATNRYRGAGEAAKYGAKAMVIRTVSNTINDHPHTGSMGYPDDTSIARIPGVAISTRDAELLSDLLKQDKKLRLYIRTTSQMLPDVLSYNVIGEIKGATLPDEIVVVGAHLDAWDNGDGAHDDGAGCVQSMEVLRVYKALGIRPERTVRAVLFMNEENGLRGGKKYAEVAAQENSRHIAAIESDAGGFSPRGFSIDDTITVVQQIQQYKPLFAPYLADRIVKGFGGADINPMKPQGTVVIGLNPDTQRYFEYHHAATDKFSEVNQRELELGAAAMASLAYLLAKYGIEKNISKP